MRCVVVVAGLCLVAAACTGKRAVEAASEERAPAPADAPVVAPTAEPAPAVAAAVAVGETKPSLVARREAGVFIDGLGQSPRRVLSIAATVGASATVSLRMQMDLAVGVGTQTVPSTEIPAITLQAHTEVTAVTPDRVIATLRTTNVVAQDTAVESDRVRKALTEAVADLAAAKATIAWDRRGGATTMTMEKAAETAAETAREDGDDGARMKPSLDGLFDTLRPMFITLPADAVGVGATWEVVDHRVEGGAQMQQVLRYTVRGFADDTVQLSWTTDRGVVAVQDTDAGRIEAHAAVGVGTLVFDLSVAGPRSADAEIDSRTYAHVQFGQTASPVIVHQGTRLALTIDP